MVYLKNKRAVILLLALFALCFAAGTAWAEQAEDNSVTVDIFQDISMSIPADDPASLLHTHKTHPAPTTEVFSMRIGEEVVPLYRFDFGNAQAGTPLGVLRTDAGDIPVTFQVFELSEQRQAAMDAETLADYHEQMENINIVMEAILADPRFTTENSADSGELREAVMAHWTLSLPEAISWTESEADGAYHAAFYGRIQGEDIPLYTVTIADDEAGDPMGMFSLNGEEKMVSIGFYPLEQYVYWSETDYDLAYLMMDTINDVIEAIMESENYLGE